MAKKLFKQIHLWLSIPFGIIFIVMALTGSILVFQDEIENVTNYKMYNVEVLTGVKMLSADSLTLVVNSSLKKDSVNIMKLPREEGKAAMGKLSKGRKTFVYANPYTGEITGINDATKGFFATVMKLHRWLLLPMTTGRWITGISSICFFFIVISGLVRIIQINKGKIAKYFLIKGKCKGYPGWFKIHCVLGVWSLVFSLLFILTGLMWSFPWYKEAVGSLFGITDGKELMNIVKMLHFGQWGGLFSKILTFLAALSGALIAILGYVMYFKRNMRK